jgi:hypothetical protein
MFQDVLRVRLHSRLCSHSALLLAHVIASSFDCPTCWNRNFVSPTNTFSFLQMKGTSNLDLIVGALRADKEGAKYEHITFDLTEGNKFTLLDTPRLWDTGPVAPTTLFAGESFCHAIAKVIGEAQAFVDISLLWWIGVGLPDGAFQGAFL